MDYIAELQKDYDALVAQLQDVDRQERELAEKRQEIVGKMRGIELAAQKFSEITQALQQSQMEPPVEEAPAEEADA